MLNVKGQGSGYCLSAFEWNRLLKWIFPENPHNHTDCLWGIRRKEWKDVLLFTVYCFGLWNFISCTVSHMWLTMWLCSKKCVIWGFHHYMTITECNYTPKVTMTSLGDTILWYHCHTFGLLLTEKYYPVHDWELIICLKSNVYRSGKALT